MVANLPENPRPAIVADGRRAALLNDMGSAGCSRCANRCQHRFPETRTRSRGVIWVGRAAAQAVPGGMARLPLAVNLRFCH
jgi:hypothetical protein